MMKKINVDLLSTNFSINNMKQVKVNRKIQRRKKKKMKKRMKNKKK
jgi:hypothetical protein